MIVGGYVIVIWMIFWIATIAGYFNYASDFVDACIGGVIWAGGFLLVTLPILIYIVMVTDL